MTEDDQDARERRFRGGGLLYVLVQRHFVEETSKPAGHTETTAA